MALPYPFEGLSAATPHSRRAWDCSRRLPDALRDTGGQGVTPEGTAVFVRKSARICKMR